MLDPTSSFGRRFKTLPTTPDRRPLPFGDVPVPRVRVLPYPESTGPEHPKGALPTTILLPLVFQVAVFTSFPALLFRQAHRCLTFRFRQRKRGKQPRRPGTRLQR